MKQEFLYWVIYKEGLILFDRVLTSRIGVFAVDCLLENKSKVMVGIIGDKIVTVPIDDALKGGQDIDDDLVRVCDIISI